MTPDCDVVGFNCKLDSIEYMSLSIDLCMKSSAKMSVLLFATKKKSLVNVRNNIGPSKCCGTPL